MTFFELFSKNTGHPGIFLALNASNAWMDFCQVLVFRRLFVPRYAAKSHPHDIRIGNWRSQLAFISLVAQNLVKMSR